MIAGWQLDMEDSMETAALSFDDVRTLAQGLPEVTERLCYGTPTLFVRRVVLARLREDGQTLAIKCELGEREFLIETQPAVFFLTDHYLKSSMVLVNLGLVGRDELGTLIARAWQLVAPPRLARSYREDAS
jgi:hypothetical protein